MECPFCRIADGSAAAHIVAEGPRVVAFADHKPLRRGHLQVIPRAHVEHFDALPPDLARDVFALAQDLARVLKTAYAVSRVGFVFTGHDVPHCHAHLVPLYRSDDITSLRYFDVDGDTLPRRDLWATEPKLAEEARRLRAIWEA